MQVDRLELTDFRNYHRAALELGPGLTAVLGRNGEGKSNLIEAVAWLATQSSFRGVPNEALIRAGTGRAIIRADAHRGARELLIEAELVGAGRNRIQVNRQKLQRARDLLGFLQVTVFSPDDLALVKGGPGERRRYIDDLLVARAAKHDLLRSDLDRILRQRINNHCDAEKDRTEGGGFRFCVQAGVYIGEAQQPDHTDQVEEQANA